MSTTAPVKETFATSLESGNHRLLNQLTGNWQGSTKTWFEPNVIADESPMRGTIKSILGGRYVQLDYTGSMQGKSFEGIMIFGYDLHTKKFQSTWADTFHMGTEIMRSEGEKQENGFAVTGHYMYGVTHGPAWGWRTEVQIAQNTLTITAYNISPEGEEAKATETVFTREA